MTLEAICNEEGGRSDNRSKGQHRAFLQSKPDDDHQENRDNSIKPGSLTGKKTFSGQSEFFGFKKQPVKEEKYEEHPTADKKDRRALLNSSKSRLVARQCGREGLQWPQSRCYNPDDQPGQKTADAKNSEAYSPGQKPPPGARVHARQHFRINDGVVNAGDGFEKSESGYGQDGRSNVHVFPSLLDCK